VRVSIADRHGEQEAGMAIQLQHDIPGHQLPEEWQTLLTQQARSLEAMLTRVAETVTTVNTRTDQTQEKTQRLSYLLTQTEQFLTIIAQQNIGIEQEHAGFQAAVPATWALPPETARRLHLIEQVNAALHANLTTARQYLADLRHTMEHGPT
jgi:uncharacterized phage infection (PIP) family protein YhgE